MVHGACSGGEFHAAPEAAATELSFFAYGDTRNGVGTHDAIAGQLISTYTTDPAFQTLILAPGDLVGDGEAESAWTEEFFDPRYPNIRALLSSLSFLPVMGNHEGNGALFRKYFPMPFVASGYWSFDYGPAHIALLDQYTPYGVGSAQHSWLANDLAASAKQWKFIVLHQPGWSAGGGHANDPLVQGVIQPLAERYGVAIIFGGHNHYYARALVRGVQHLTIGGGGAPLHVPDPQAPFVVATSQSHSFVEIAIRGDTLTGTARRSDGTVIEVFAISRRACCSVAWSIAKPENIVTTSVVLRLSKATKAGTVGSPIGLDRY